VKRLAISILYAGSVVAANWLTKRYGLVPIGFGLLVAAGTFAAGVALLARNIGQDVVGRVWIVLLMLVGILLSWWLASPALAVASAAAFALSETTDMAVYTKLKKRGRPRALLAAALLGALVDTLVFLRLAGFPLTVDAVLGQMLVKVGISGLVALVLGVRHQVLRQPVHAESS
jgi:uncharacterized PurR-regulated membrane protein YhhQ (DUF165 family)